MQKNLPFDHLPRHEARRKAEHRLPAAYLRVIPTDLAPGKSLPAPATVRVLELPVPAGRVKGAHRYSVGIFDLPTDT